MRNRFSLFAADDISWQPIDVPADCRLVDEETVTRDCPDYLSGGLFHIPSRWIVGTRRVRRSYDPLAVRDLHDRFARIRDDDTALHFVQDYGPTHAELVVVDDEPAVGMELGMLRHESGHLRELMELHDAVERRDYGAAAGLRWLLDGSLRSYRSMSESDEPKPAHPDSRFAANIDDEVRELLGLQVTHNLNSFVGSLHYIVRESEKGLTMRPRGKGLLPAIYLHFLTSILSGYGSTMCRDPRCGRRFTKTAASQVYCSERCSSRLRQSRLRARRRLEKGPRVSDTAEGDGVVNAGSAGHGG